MPCLPIPIPSAPAVPAPFSFTPPSLPQPKVATNVCCQAINLGSATPPSPLAPLVVNPAVVTVLRSAAKALQQYLDQLPLECPRQ